MTQRNQFVAAVLSALLMSACSHSASDVPDLFPKEAFNNKVVGPAVEGSWSSQCNPDFGTQFRQLKASFQGQTVTRTDNQYADKDCTQITNKSEMKGVFRWADKTSYGGFVIDYHFDLGGGVTQIISEEILIENSQLYLSRFAIGFGSMDKSFPMTKDGAANPTPAPADQNPVSVEGVRATSWKDAKYAYCNAQGYGFFLDFQNQDLSQVQEGTVTLQSHTCGSTHALGSPSTSHFVLSRTAPFKMTLDDGYLQDNGKGVVDTWAVIAGNSGICTFLQNKGIKEVFNASYGMWECE